MPIADDAEATDADPHLWLGDVLGERPQRSMQLQVTVQDARVWIGNAANTVEIGPVCLHGG